MPGGLPCGAPPLRESTLCYWHDPAKADDLAEAQRLGGLRRKRERTIAAAYDFTGLGSVEAIQRILMIATTDVLGLENSIARARVLISAALAATKLLETGDLQARIELLEATRRSGQSEPSAGGLDGGLLGGP
jgi:hypothetical protein